MFIYAIFEKTCVKLYMLRLYNLKYFFLVLCLLAICSQASAQRVDRFQGFWIRNDIDKLSKKVTKDAETDSEKVLAIHTWLTNHVKYDIKKFVTHNYTKDETQRVLLRRKAICVGYADLFDDMCAAVGVLSTSVPGYSKSQDKDVTDSFYLDEHIWNAAKLEDRWVLIDNTWDAGYIRWYRKSLETYVFRAFLIDYTRYVYDPKFIFAPHKKYFAKSGIFFSTDHLSSMELWQLTDTSISIQEFQNDSTNYYFSTKNDRHSSNREIASLDIYAKLSDENKQIRMGRPAYNFNNRNHYLVAGSEFLKSQRLLNSLIENESVDTNSFNRVILFSDLSRFHCDSNSYYLKQEYKALERKNRLKVKEQKEYNKLYTRNIENVRRTSLRGKDKMKKLSAVAKKYNHSMDNRLSTRSDDTKFYRMDFEHKYDYISDSLREEEIVDSLQQTMQFLRDQLKALRHQDDSLEYLISVKFISQRNYINAVDGHFSELSSMRAGGFDDRDYPIVATKSSFEYVDSILFIDTVSISDTIEGYIRQVYRASKDLDRAYRNFNSACKRLKKMQVENTNLVRLYEETRVFYLLEIEAVASWLIQQRGVTRGLKSNFKVTAKWARKKLRKGIKLEKTIFKPNSEYRKHYKALSSVNKDLKKKVADIKRRSLKKK